MRAPEGPGHVAQSEGAWPYRLPPDGGAAEGFGPRELGRVVVVPVLLTADPESRLPLDLPGLDGPGGRNDGPAARPLPGRRYRRTDRSSRGERVVDGHGDRHSTGAPTVGPLQRGTAAGRRLCRLSDGVLAVQGDGAARSLTVRMPGRGHAHRGPG